ncbi:glutamate racemase [Croceivirga thetidis]|uniref:Glutamate racemase n=1 Tax=Croceivirga thetidis TaxID=2721623 RepID=A0ABX1GP56_9FLAO|nr:glutamate racemase [Croceivirga thetidis]NKI30552.1 glutamate racemase [Croceivirga thetidis]
MSQSPIGIFDSGVGGISIWKEINQLLPNESTIYLADSKNAPYGTKSTDEILALCIENTELLLAKGSKLIVVACNTATTNAIQVLRENYPVKFIGIEPAIKPAALNTKTKKVGILATEGTLSSQLFQNTSKLYASGITVIEQIGEGLVTLIEAGRTNSKETRKLLAEYVEPMIKANIDALVLGCTHYPFLIPTLKTLLPSTVQIIDSGFAVAKQTKSILETEGLGDFDSSAGSHQFFTNADVEVLSSFVPQANTEISFLDF